MSTSKNQEAAFIARVTAGTTHEIRNVFAIVKESAGLIEDIIGFADKNRPLSKDKLMRILERIDAQVSRGVELISTLNRFAHSMDDAGDGTDTDLNHAVQQVVFLCHRFAKKKRQLIQVRTADQDLTINVDSIRLQMALFTAVECCLELLPEGSTIAVNTGRQGDRMFVEFVGEVREKAELPAPTQTSAWSQLKELLDSLGALVEISDAAYCFRIVLPTKSVA